MKSRLLKDQRFVLLLVFVFINIIFTLSSRNFLQLSNYFNMIKQSAMIMMTGTAATLLMMTGNFDLSTGSNLAFSGVLYTLLAVSGVPLFAAALVVVAGGMGFGVVNGVLVSRFNFPPFIASLGMLYIGRGLALVVCGGQSIRIGIPPTFDVLARGNLIGIPIPVLLIILFTLIFWFLQKKTLLGKYAMAIGGNRSAAFLSGINTGRIVLFLYILVGALAAFSGVMTASRIGAGDPRTGTGFELDVIVAILLGGTSLNGGKGSVIGMLLGAMVVTVLGNGLNMMNVLPFWQSILKGAILVLAIVLNDKLALFSVRKARSRKASP